MPLSLTKLDNNAWLWLKVNSESAYDRLAMPFVLPRQKTALAQAKTYVLFVGQPRSGHSVVGSVLDAHPNALISHRLDSLKYLQTGCTLPEVFYLIMKNSQRFAKTERKLTAYSYNIDNAWQGQSENLQVIGDQEGKWSAQRLLANAPRLQEQLGKHAIALRLFNVVRNPFDNIATWSERSGLSIARITHDYFTICDQVQAIEAHYGSDALLRVYHERFIANFDAEFQRILDFVQLNGSAELLSACTPLIYHKPHRSRDNIQWQARDIQAITKKIQQYDFLHGYDFEQDDFQG